MLERIAAGRTDLVYDWVAKGGSPTATVEGASVLDWCIYYGDVSGIRHLIASGVQLERLGPNLGLSSAAFHGHWQLCEFLLEQGADPNHADMQSGEVPLHSALCSPDSIAHEHVVRVLLAFGADPNRSTLPNAETGDFMRDVRTRGEAPLHRAAAYGTLDAIALLLGAGAQIDARDAHGDSPLAWASWALRDTRILRSLCFGPFRVNPERLSMSTYLLGKPLAASATEPT